MILKNGIEIDETPKSINTKQAHKKCFDSFNAEKDTIELRNSGDVDGMKIQVNLIINQKSKKLYFGSTDQLDTISIVNKFFECNENEEKAFSIKIQNGTIKESECRGKRCFYFYIF